MSHWGGVGTLFGAAVHTVERDKHSLPRSRRPSSAKVPSSRREKENAACINRIPKDGTHPSITPVLFDPFAISLGDVPMETLSYQSKTGTASHQTTKTGTASHQTGAASKRDSLDQKLDVQQMLGMIRNQLKSRGEYEIASIRSKFRRADKDDDDSLNFSEFKRLLAAELNIQLPEQNLKELFIHFDTDHCNDIKYDHFLQQLHGEMSSYRKKFMNWVFDIIDKSHTGVIDMNELLDAYNAEGCPEVKAGKLKPVDALKRFIRLFDVGGVPDGQVTRKEFHDYYAAISVCITSDAKFEELMKSTWNVSGTPPPSQQPPTATWEPKRHPQEVQSKSIIWAPSKTSGKPAPSQTPKKPAPKPDLRSAVSAVTAMAAIATPPTSPSNKISGLTSPTNKSSGLTGAPSASLPGVQHPNARRGSHADSREESERHQPQNYKNQKLDLEKLLTIVRNELKSRGAHEIAGVRAKFRRADKDDDEALNLEEFKHMLTDQLDIHLSKENMTDLFKAFDLDNRDDIKYDHFLVMLRGEMNTQRKAIMNQIFASIDKDKSGVIDVNDLLAAYDPEGEPDVCLKKTKPVAAMKRFIKAFDVGGLQDGKVTKKEFEDYYASLSAGIDSDQEFEKVMKNAWKHSSLLARPGKH
jgi:Ca2+-binding EF-hand superfamily protein